MESQELESRVWQRVVGGAPMELGLLAQLSQQSATALGALVSATTGQTQRTLQQLHQLSSQTAGTLRGICILRGMETNPAPGYTPETGLRRNLARAVHRSRELQRGLDSWSASGEYGAIFRFLAHREAEIGAGLLGLLSNA